MNVSEYTRHTIISICNEKGIPTIELQHGIITYSEPIEHKTFDINNCNDVNSFW